MCNKLLQETDGWIGGAERGQAAEREEGEWGEWGDGARGGQQRATIGQQRANTISSLYLHRGGGMVGWANHGRMEEKKTRSNPLPDYQTVNTDRCWIER